MPGSTIELVKNLMMQSRLFAGLAEAFGPELRGDDLTFSTELSYSRLQFTIMRSEALHLQYTLQEFGGSVQADCYCDDPGQVELLKKHFEPLVAGLGDLSLKRNDSDPAGHDDVLNGYLAIAESIARCGYLCTAGDDYRPGYFSRIKIDAETIRLEQINRMNSRSLDHKHNYAMRELEFDIPLSSLSGSEKTSAGSEAQYIGVMRIRFSDRSSQNNRMCGDRILEKIEAEKQSFGTR